MVNFSLHNEFDPVFERLGIRDVIDPGINQKSLKYKLDFWMKTLNAQAKKIEEQIFEGQKIHWAEPLTIKDDIWLANPADMKFILSKWVVKCTGPSPSISHWKQSKLRKDLWRFDISGEHKKSLLESEESWYFKGEEAPGFNEKEKLWLFTGKEFELYFIHNCVLHSRFKVANKELQIAKNSAFATKKKKIILGGQPELP